MDRYSNEEIILAFKTSNSKFLTNIYKSYFPMVKKLVLTNSGKIDDAEDLLGDALTTFLIHLEKNPDFNLTSSFRTYLYSICRNQWLDKLKLRKNYREIFYDSDTYCKDLNEEIDNIIHDLEVRKHLLFYKHFAKISETCRKILGMFFDKIALKEIALKLNISAAYVKKKNHECKKSLIEKVLNDKEYNSILELSK